MIRQHQPSTFQEPAKGLNKENQRFESTAHPLDLEPGVFEYLKRLVRQVIVSILIALDSKVARTLKLRGIYI